MQPMLAATVKDLEELRYPLYGSPKLDGIRALVQDGRLVSRNLKMIPNGYIQRILPLRRMQNWDGEIIVGQPNAPAAFRATTSGAMSEDGEPNFTFWVFDYIPGGAILFKERFKGLQINITSLAHPQVKLVPQVLLRDPFEVSQYEETMLARGYEGIMLRSPDGAYKHGRSTLREAHLMKLKRFADSEAEVLELVEQLHNGNPAVRNAAGKLERSSHKANKQGKKTLGALAVRDVHTKVEFEIGSGLDDETRVRFWKNPNLVKGKIVKYKYFPTGSKDKPRFPVYLGIRED